MHDPQRFAVAIIVGGEPVHEPFTERFPLGYAQAGAKIVPPERPESYAEPFAPEELDRLEIHPRLGVYRNGVARLPTVQRDDVQPHRQLKRSFTDRRARR